MRGIMEVNGVEKGSWYIRSMDTEDGCLTPTDNSGRDEWIKCKKTAEERYVKCMRNLFPLVVPKHWRVDKLYARLSAAVTRIGELL
jgi:hypothetical protein